ncbi:MAG: hypothetical protein M3Q34_01295 [bacterium]|nr:hypothetical protein [bacterium]
MANKTVMNVAYAQTQSGGYNVTNFSSSNGPGIRGYIKGLAPAISQLPGCKDIIKSKIKSLFKNVKGVVIKIAGKKLANKLADKLKAETSEQTMIQTKSPDTDDKLTGLDEKVTRGTESTERLTENELCLKAIGVLVAQRLIQKVTLSIITWIQSGYEGKPFFVQNPGKFFKDIAKNEILQFGVEISDNPYGTAYLQGVVNTYNKHFQDNARYSLNELIQQTTPEFSDVAFSVDFSQGGWNAWDALTSVPANNTMGFEVISSNELAKRLIGTNKNTATKLEEDLNRAGGFLGQEQCADPDTGITRAQHDAALEAGAKEYEGTVYSDDGDIIKVGTATGYTIGTCKRWEYVTPGKMIADKAQKALGYQEDSLNNIKDLNTAIAAIMDAVLAQFSSKLQEGFVKVTNEGSDGSLILSSYNTEGNFITPQTEKDFAPSQLNSKWLEENPDFNIRTDITQALIDEQRIYSQKLEEQNLEIPQLIMDLRQASYCLPGPDSDWEERSSVDAFYDSINIRPDLKGFDIAGTILDIALPIGGAALSSVIGFDPTAILSGVAQALLDDKKEKKIKAMMASYIGDLFGVHIYGAGQKDGIGDNDFGDKGHQDQVLDEGDVRSVVENTWSSYADNIYKIYFNGAKSLAAKAGAMPLVTNEIRNEYEKISAYQNMAEDNYDTIQTKKSVISRLSVIKDQIEALGPAPELPNINDYANDPVGYQEALDDYDVALNEYELELKDPIAEFSRLSNDMVTGDDIAEVDNVLKELIDKRNYVWDDLLTGPGGCEKHLEEFHANSPLEYSKFVRRQPYSLPVYYFYGTVDPNDNVEWNEKIKWNKDLLRGLPDSCPTGWSGTPPLCVDPNLPKCPTGSIGTYPKCVGPGLTCPTGWTGIFPLCKDPSAPVCPAGSNGIYPKCTVPTGVSFSPYEGFLYGMVYYNRWAGPDFSAKPQGSGPDDDFDADGIPNNSDDDDDDDEYPDVDPDTGEPNDPDPYDPEVPGPDGTVPPKTTTSSGRMSLCPEYIQFPEDIGDDDIDLDGDGAYVEISLPSGTDDNNVPIDLGGLEPKGYGNGHANPNGRDYRNICGVIPREFEDKFQIF